MLLHNFSTQPNKAIIYSSGCKRSSNDQKGEVNQQTQNKDKLTETRQMAFFFMFSFVTLATFNLPSFLCDRHPFCFPMVTIA